MNRLAIPIVALSLGACTLQHVTTGSEYTEKIASVCEQAVAILPMFPQLEPWLSACRTATGVAKLALDSSSLVWLIGILEKL